MTTNDFRNYQDKKVYQIAMELLTTEKNYVRKLHLIDQVFHFEIVVKNREHRIFPMEVIPQMFSNIKSIYQFHHDFLLLQLEKRMGEWDVNPKIGDVMKKFAPFLKLYTEYVQNFDNASSTINFWMEKSDRFYRLVHDLEKLPECGQLTLHHHMLEPIQRVPRYLILLKEYQKFLPHDSLDREDIKQALDLITIAVRHSNEAMKTTDKFRKLVDINESLGGTLDLISPMREYIKEGKIKRLSARDGSHIDRYLFLFNDLLLICQSLPLKLGHNQQFRIKCRMDVEDMEVIEDGHNLLTPNTFYVNCKQKSVEFQASTLEEKASWLKELQDAIIAFKKRKLSANETLNYRHDQLGKRAPTWVKDHETSMCMICSLTFNTFKRRHHCRACGIVVCAKCSSGKARLAYLENREKRVCNKCFQILNQLSKNLADLSASVSMESSEQRKGPGILQVKASDPCVICGYLFMCCDKKSWQLFFFSVHENFVLYAFKAHQDMVAMTSLPLPGYKVEADTKLDSDRSFKVHHTSQKKVYYFQTDDKSVRDKWIDVLQKAAQLVLPTDYSRDISSASPSSFVGCMTLKSSNSTSTKAVLASL